MAKEKWTIETVEIEARKYNVKEHFIRGCPGGYKYAVRHGLVKNFTWFETRNKPAGYWTKERCEIESKKYKNKTDFKKNSGGAYDAAVKGKYLKELTWLKRQRKRN